MKTPALASLVLLVACNNSSPPKEANREAAAPVSVTVEAKAPAEAAPPPTTASSAGVPCGEVTCTAGQVCCNASCGICTPPDGACIQLACAPKADAGARATPDAAPKTGACASDADCHLYGSYCPTSPCACLALGPGEAAPTCSKPSVNCFVAPCMKRVARCEAGRCIARPHQP